MVKCESLRIHMFRITHTGKSVNFPVTKNDLSPDINKLNSCPFSLCQKKHPTGCQFVCINDTHVLNQKHTLVRTGTYNIIHFYQNVKGNVFTQFCWGVQIRGGGSKSANGFGRGGGGVHIHQRIWTGGSISASGFGPEGPNLGSKSAGTPGRRIESFEVPPAIQQNPRLQVNFVSFRSF